jgi:hypothetical protein
MIRWVGTLLIHKPLNILAIALVLGAVWAVARFGLRAPHPNALLTPVIAMFLYAGWEWLVLVYSPEANIRVDLMLIWPVLLILTAWAFFRAFR